MKMFIIFLFLVPSVYGDVIDLGTIDSSDKRLDQRFTVNFDQKDRERSFDLFFSSKELELIREFEFPDQKIKTTHPDEEWIKLMEGHI